MAERSPEPESEREIVLTRLFDAPPDLVFEAWTNPKHVVHWWGPNGFTNTILEMDVREGGVWRFIMHGPDGTNYPNRISFQEVDRPRRLVYLHDDDGAGEQKPFLVTTTFTSQDGKTLVTHRLLLDSAEERRRLAEFGAIEGGKQTLARLAEYLEREMAANASANEEEFAISRTFDAPRDVVWKAWTEADRLKHWWGPKGFSMIHCTVDLRPGGEFFYGMRAANGFEMWGKFTYREIAPPEKLVFVVSFSDKDGGVQRHFLKETWPLEVLNVATFTEVDGKTTVDLRGLPINATDEEIKTFIENKKGMNQGFSSTFDQLDAYLKSL